VERRKQKKIFGLKRDEVTGEWRDRIERSFCFVHRTIYSVNQRRIRWAGRVEHMGYRRGA